MKKLLVALMLSACVGFLGNNHAYAFSDETYYDMAELTEHCGMEFGGDYDYCVKVLKENYEAIGIRFNAYDNKANEYYDKRSGKNISHLNALSMLIEFGHRNGRYGRYDRYDR